MLPLIWVLIGIIAAAATVAVVTVAVLTRQKLVQIAKQHKSIDQVSLRISENIRQGNFNRVRVGLLTHTGRQTSTIEIHAEEVEDSIKVGYVLTV